MAHEVNFMKFPMIHADERGETQFGVQDLRTVSLPWVRRRTPPGR